MTQNKRQRTTPAADEANRPGATELKPGDNGNRSPKGDNAGQPTIDLDRPELYLNRELTWLEFNKRVLFEAEDIRTPLLERVKFLAIVGNNLDEFFMKRIGGLKQQIGAGLQYLTVDGRTPAQQLKECHEVIRDIEVRMSSAWRELKERLRAQEIVLADYPDLTKNQQAELRRKYIENIFPLVTPQAMDPAHPFPFVSNLSLNFLVGLRYEDDSQPLLARIKIPVGRGIARFLQLQDTQIFVRLEDVISHNLDLLFPDMVIDSCHLFRVTRNAITDGDEDQADDLLALIESELRERRFAPIVRLEVAIGMPPLLVGRLASELGLDAHSDVFENDGVFSKRDLFEIAALDRSELKYVPHRPVDHPQLDADRNIFHTIRDKGAILLHHPFESFATSVERFLEEAAVDPKVRAIKMTVYRTSSDSRVVSALVLAAQNNKQVAVVVELKARFDEDANIRWASRLEEAGIHVTYGVVGLKTHCKVILVIRQDYTGLKRYAHVGTGNYHSGTARIYTDLGILTCDDDIGHDLTELFNYLTTGYKPKRRYRKLLPAPKHLKPALLEKIRREIQHQAEHQNGLIQMKMNALEDRDVTRALYEASQAGVKIDLIVRDTCRLRPGLPGISETCRVVSIVGRFLEHSRIYYFANNGDEEFLIGSADAMQRNLESRVEAVVPVEPEDLRAEMRRTFDTLLADERNAWDMLADGSYVQRRPKDPEAQASQQILVAAAEKRHREATRLRRRKPKSLKRRSTD